MSWNAQGFDAIRKYKEIRDQERVLAEKMSKFPEVKLSDGDLYRGRFLSDKPHVFFEVNNWPKPSTILADPETYNGEGRPRICAALPFVVEEIKIGAAKKEWFAKQAGKEKAPNEKTFIENRIGKVAIIVFRGKEVDTLLSKCERRNLLDWDWSYTRVGTDKNTIRDIEHNDKTPIPEAYKSLELPDLAEIFAPTTAKRETKPSREDGDSNPLGDAPEENEVPW